MSGESRFKVRPFGDDSRWVTSVAMIAPMGVFCIGVGLLRRAHRSSGLALAASAVGAAGILAIAGVWRPMLGLIAIAGFLGGLEVDRPGDTRKRVLGLLGVAAGMLAALIGTFYA